MLMPWWRGVVMAAALSAAALPRPLWAGGEPPMAGSARCRFVVPEGWAARPVRWSGGCHAGLAEGRGILRVYEHGQVAGTFFGTLQAGQLALGVIEQLDGFVAGRFEAGKLVADGERNTLIMAFDEASAAALQLAERYRKAGNAASAHYYKVKATQLSAQMD